MKRIFTLILAVLTALTLVACEGNYFEIDIQKPVTIPEDGWIVSTRNPSSPDHSIHQIAHCLK